MNDLKTVNFMNRDYKGKIQISDHPWFWLVSAIGNDLGLTLQGANLEIDDATRGKEEMSIVVSLIMSDTVHFDPLDLMASLIPTLYVSTL